jgi:hypothetical protein
MIHEENENLQNEETERAREEPQVVAELEDAGIIDTAAAGLPFSAATDPEDASNYYTYAGDMSPEDYEKMCAAIDADRGRLSQVRRRLHEIDDRLKVISCLLFEERDKVDPNDVDALHEENEALQSEQIELDHEERQIVAALEDAGVHDTAETEPSDIEEPPAESSNEEVPAQDDKEETGSFAIGECKYCGREWGVTLEGSRDGGYPTQRTANAAATRVCDCPAAKEARAPIFGVALAVTVGGCRYCGQMQEVGPHPSQEAADDTASEVCDCPRARMERRVSERIEDARDRVHRLFGEGAEELGFKPISPAALDLLEGTVEQIARNVVSSATLQIRGQCKVKLALTSKGNIKINRTETRSYNLESGE